MSAGQAGPGRSHARRWSAGAALSREVNEAFAGFERLGSLAALYNDLATDLTNGYLSVASHRLNDVMKVLTIITAINMPELHNPHGYYVIMGFMAVLGMLLLGAFRL